MQTDLEKHSLPEKNQDIQTAQDIEILVDLFYQKIRKDELLGPVFNKKIVTDDEWVMHLETMNNFWQMVLFSRSAYRGNPFPRHIDLKLDPSHFERWAALFEQTVDENFSGEQSEAIKKRARIMRQVFETKLFNNAK
jgi:hemoglobin